MAKHRTIPELQEILNEFEKENWVAPKDLKGATHHTCQHIAKLLGKFGTITEKWDHGFEADLTPLKTEIIPDLLYYALSLAQLYNIDLETAFLERLKVNEQKVKGWKEAGLIKTG